MYFLRPDEEQMKPLIESACRMLILLAWLPLVSVAQSPDSSKTRGDLIETRADSLLAYVCPMHPEEKATTAARCPKCGMALRKLEPRALSQLDRAKTLLEEGKSEAERGWQILMLHQQPVQHLCPGTSEVFMLQIVEGGEASVQ